MNPLIELKERLVYIAVAGTQLTEEDFRLKKTIENFSVMAEKNTVFKKIYTDLQTMLSAQKEQQVFLLLNILGLVDAVLYTQATSTVEGDVQELPEYDTLGEIIQIRYSQISPLIEALTTTGSGRIDVLQRTIINHSDFLTDYRVINALINDLGDPYNEMADLVYSTLEAMCIGKSIQLYDAGSNYTRKTCSLPPINKQQILIQLKKNFDPQGKKEMAKRLSLIMNLAKESENDWYISLLSTAKKEIREATISALQYSESNIPVLFEMLKKERGKAKETVYEVLGKLYKSEHFDFWKDEITKTPTTVQYLKYTNDDDISDLIADRFKEELQKYLDSNEQDIRKTNILLFAESLYNKTSDKMFELYRWIIQNSNQFPKGKNTLSVLDFVTSVIDRTLIMYCPTPLINFLNNLTQEEQIKLSSTCFIADILTLSATEFYDKWAENNLIYGKLGQLKKSFEKIWCNNNEYKVLCWKQDLNHYMYYGYYYNDDTITRKTKEPLDIRWFDLFTKNNWVDILSQIIDRNSDKQIKEKVGDFYYNKMINIPKTNNFTPGQLNTFIANLNMLNICDYNKYDGLIVAVCKAYPNIAIETLRIMFERYHQYAGDTNTQKEALNVLEYYDKSSQSGNGVEYINQMLINCGFLKGLRVNKNNSKFPQNNC